MNPETLTDPCLKSHLQGHTECITQIRFKPKGDKIASSSLDTTVIVWNLKDTARCISHSAHGERVYDLGTQSTRRYRRICSSPVRSVDFHPAGTMVVTGSDDKSVKVWRIPESKFLTSFTGHKNWLRSAKFSPNGKFVASCGDDKSLRIFDVNTRSCICTFTDELGVGRQLAWHPYRNIVAAALSCNRVKMFDLCSQELIQLYKVHKASVNDVAFHPNGNFMLTGSDDETMKILDIREGRPIYTLTCRIGRVMSVDFNYDGSSLACAGSDNQILVWKSNLDNYDFFADDVKLENEILETHDTPEFETTAGNSNSLSPSNDLIIDRFSSLHGF
uniref:Uncharacterized protein n=1 Tax=Glossina pallidipes TaxID=7398 RepID=A0A1A9Z0I1_GLOPL